MFSTSESFDPMSLVTGPISPFMASVFASGAADVAGPDSVQLSGNDGQDREAIVAFFVSHLASLPERSAGVSALMNQWNQDTLRAAAVEALFGEFSSIFLQNPALFRLSGHPLRVALVNTNKGAGAEDSSQQEDELLAVATSVTSRLFMESPLELGTDAAGAQPPSKDGSGAALTVSGGTGGTTTTTTTASTTSASTSTTTITPAPVTITRSRTGSSALSPRGELEAIVDEKEPMVAAVVELLSKDDCAPRKKDELSADLVKSNRKLYDDICELWGSLHDMLKLYPDLFVVHGDGPGKETVKLRPVDDETALMGQRRTVMEAIKHVLKQNYGTMHPEDLRSELHRTRPMLMGRITHMYGGFSQLLVAEAGTLEHVEDPNVLTPPAVRLRWPAFCALCGVWPETPEAWQAHIFNQRHTDMRRSVLRHKDGRDPDRWPVLRMVEERVRRAGGRMKLGNIPNFGKNRPVFATYIRKLFGGFKQLVECDPRFRLQMEDGSSDPTVVLLDDWRRDRLEGVVIRVKQKDTLIWIRPDTNPSIEFFLHRDRSVGGREIANSPAFVLPRVGDRMSFLPSNVPADPNPFAEGAVVLESVPDLRIRFSGTVVRAAPDHYVVRPDFQSTLGGALDDGSDLFEVGLWRDEGSRLSVSAGATKVTFIRSARPPRRYPLVDDVATDPAHYGALPFRQQQQQQQLPNGTGVYVQHHHHHHHQPQQQQQHHHHSQRLIMSSDSIEMASVPAGGGSSSSSSSSSSSASSGLSRRPTWPVAYFDPSATAAAALSGTLSPTGSGAVTPASGGERTPLRLNPAKPPSEFNFRFSSPVVAGGPLGPPPPAPTSVVQLQQQQQPPPPPSVLLRGESKAIQLSLTTYDNEQDLQQLIPPSVKALMDSSYPRTLTAAYMDVGLPAVLRFVDGTSVRGKVPVTRDEIQKIVDLAGNLGPERSSVYGRSLHLCSAIVHPLTNELTGLTVKVGRAIVGLADVLSDFLDKRKSVLLIGDFSTGKTCLLRDVARRMSEDRAGRHVAVIDSIGELGGAADGVSHVGLGSARCIRCAQRGQVPDAVDHTVGRHAIGAIVVDNVCTAEAVSAVLRARRRGVAVVASIGSPSLPAAACDEVFRPLFGKSATAAASAKFDYMRSASFDVAVVLNGIGQWIVHPFVNPSVEAVLTGKVDSVAVARISINEDGSGTWTQSMYPHTDEASNWAY